MNKKIATLALISSFISCANTVVFQSYDGIKHLSTQKVDVFLTDVPTREYTEIGRIDVKGRIYETESMTKSAKKKAKEIGADGLIFLQENFENRYVGPETKPFRKKTFRHLTFVAIKYKY